MLLFSRLRRWLAGKLLGAEPSNIVITRKAAHTASDHLHLVVSGGQVLHLHEPHGRDWVVFYDGLNDAFVCHEAGRLASRATTQAAVRTASQQMQRYATERCDPKRRSSGWMAS